jgi:putative ABC transport system permease protein
LLPAAQDDFRILSTEELAAQVSSALDVMVIFLGAIAAISLLVGGIGVMNIMLVSVLERTREIGIRKALGAQERTIWSQFLIEAALLSLTGGLVGIVLGWGIATAVGYFVQEITPVVTADTVILAVSVSVGIGLFFGFYPAWQASRLNPIDALRAE